MGFWTFLGSLFGQGRPPVCDDAPGPVATAGPTPDVHPTPRLRDADKSATQLWWAPDGDALTSMPPVERPALTTETLALERILTVFFDRSDLRLPAMPKAAERVLRLLGERAYDARRIADEIASDQVISGAVLRLANSVFYGRYEKITSLQAGVSRVGANALRSLMFQHSFQTVIMQRRGGDRLLAAMIWNQSMASAHIMRGLADVVGVEPEEAYLMGLMHDIGNVIVLKEAQEHEKTLRYKINVDAFYWLCSQYHQHFGRLVADAWGLPDRLKAVVGEHHSPEAANGEVARYIHMIALTDMISALLGYSPRASYNLLESSAAKALDLTESPKVIEFLSNLPGELNEIPSVF